MPDKLNLIKNPRFEEGKAAPRRWRWNAPGEGAGWRRRPNANGHAAAEMEIHTDAPQDSRRQPVRAVWTQRVSCASDQHYRVEARVVVEATNGERADPDGGGGLVLSVQPFIGDEPAGEVVETPPVRRADTTLRAFYKTPEGARSLDVRIGLRNAAGRAVIREVLVLPILEPDLRSHPIAAPPPPYAYPAPRRVQTIGVCGEHDGDRPLVRILRARFGEKNVRTVRPDRLQPRGGRARPGSEADAVILPDRSLPPQLRSLSGLSELAQSRLVVISPQAFADLSRGQVEVRTIRQKDDPICATVYESNFITRGFALRDVFPFASRGMDGADPRVSVQPQFRETRAFKAFCAKHDFLTVLRSETDADATSEKPICLYKPTPGGGILVMDVTPIESDPTTLDEPNLALFVLLNALGADQTSLGQYIAPPSSHREFWQELFEFGERYPEFVVRGGQHPYQRDKRLVVQLGPDPETFGLPVVPRPTILIRTGLTGDDLDGLYGTLLWLKQLVRAVPNSCPYLEALASRYRLVWIPLCAEWPEGTGWRPTNGSMRAFESDFDLASVALAVEVTNGSRRELRVTVPPGSRGHKRCAQALPALWRELFAGRYFHRAPAEGTPLDDHHGATWRQDTAGPQVVAEAGMFSSPFHRAAAAAGAQLIRLETPNSPADFMCNSVWRTDRVATLLETVIGLHCGVLVQNRRGSDLTLTLPKAVSAARNRTHIVRGTQQPGRAEASKLANHRPGVVTLRPGEAVCCFLE